MLSGVRVPDESPAPLAQLVEQMTLNHWVRGSSPRRCTKRRNQNGFVFFCASSGTRTTFARRRGVPSPSAYGRHLPRFNGGAYPEGAPKGETKTVSSFFCASSGTRTTFARRRGVPSPSAYGCHLPRFNGGAYPEGAPNKNKTNLDENSKFVLFFTRNYFGLIVPLVLSRKIL